MFKMSIKNPWVVVCYEGGRPPHIYRVSRESEGANLDVLDSDLSGSHCLEHDDPYARFPAIVDAVSFVANRVGRDPKDFVEEYSLLFPSQRKNLEGSF
jgi:hypothetical protein